MKVLVYNVNGLRAVLRPESKADFLAYLAREDADVLCLQEVKADASVVEKEKLKDCFLPLYPHAYFACGEEGLEGFKKGYAGCAVFSKQAATSFKAGLGAPEHDGQGRVLTVNYPNLVIVNVYSPNSGQKLERLEYRTEKFDPALSTFLKGLLSDSQARVLCVGDFNVAHQNCDVAGFKNYRNKIAGFCDGERDRFGEFLKLGFRDVWRDANPTALAYSEYHR